MLNQPCEDPSLIPCVQGKVLENALKVFKAPYSVKIMKGTGFLYLILILLVFLGIKISSTPSEDIKSVLILVILLPGVWILIFAILCFKIFASKRSCFKLQGNRVVLFKPLSKSSSNRSQTYEDMTVIYKEGTFLQITKKSNLFSGFMIYGDDEFIRDALEKFKINGFEVIFLKA